MQLDERILIMRDRILQLYKAYEKIWIGMAKFFSVLVVLLLSNGVIGYAPILTKSYMIAGLALLSILLPARLIMFEILGTIVVHLMYFNLLIGTLVLGIFIAVYILFIRLYPRESLLIIVTMLAMKMGIVYILPLVAGLFGGIGAILAILIGIVGHFSSLSLEMTLQSVLNTENPVIWIKENFYIYITQIFSNQELLAMLIISVIVFTIVYLIKIQSIDYAPYLAIVIGGVVNILCFLLTELFFKTSMNTFLLIIMTIISVVIVSAIQFISSPADYSRSELVKFEDEDNYYIVKVIPKMQVRKSMTKVEKVYTPPHHDEPINLEE